MSYRDPKAIIQSTGKYYTKLSQSLAQTSSRVGKAISEEAERRRKAITEASKISRDYQMTYGNQTMEAVREGESLFGKTDYESFANPITLASQLIAQDITDPAQNRYIAGVNSSAKVTATAVANAQELSKNSKEIIQNTGKPGGLDKFAPIEAQNRLYAISGAIKGESVMSLQMQEDGRAVVNMSFNNELGGVDINSTELSAIMDDPEGQLGFVNPDMSAQRKALWNNNVLAQAADGNPANKYKSSLMSEKQRSDYNKATGQTEFFKDPDVDKIKAVLQKQAGADIAALSPSQQISEYNRLCDVLNLGNENAHMDYNKSLNQEEVKELTRRYIADVIEEKMGPEPSDHSISTGKIAPRKPSEASLKRAFDAQEVNDRGVYVVNKLQDAISNNDVSSIFVGEVVGSKKDRVINASVSDDKTMVTLQLEGDVDDRVYDVNNKNDRAKLVDDFVLIEYPKSGDQIKDWYRRSTESSEQEKQKGAGRFNEQGKTTVKETVDPNSKRKQKNNNTRDFQGITSSGIRSGI